MPNTQIEKLKNITPINLGVNDIAIAKMKEEYGNLTASTPKEFKELEAGIAVFRKARLLVVERKEELKRPLLDEGKAIDAECKRLVGLIEVTEELLKARKKAYEAEKERKKKEAEEAEAKRIKAIEDKINAFFMNTRGLVGKSSAQLKADIKFFMDCVEKDTFDYQEFAIKAEDTKRIVLAELEEAYKTKVDQENKDAQIEKERLEAERKASFQDRLKAISAIGTKYLSCWQTCSILDMEEAINLLINNVELQNDWQEFKEEASQAIKSSLETLKDLIEKRKAYDSEQAELAQLRKEKAEKEKKELEEKQAQDAKVDEEKFEAVVAVADEIFPSDKNEIVTSSFSASNEGEKTEVVIRTSHALNKVYPAIEDIYQSAKIAESKSDFEEFGYQEYFNGLYTVNDIVTAFVELYERSK